MSSADPFVHLHVASGYSLQHGASHPPALVERAAAHGMDTLALTDRDGLYGAVRFALAARSAGIRPVFGVDLAVETGSSGSPHPFGQSHPSGRPHSSDQSHPPGGFSSPATLAAAGGYHCSIHPEMIGTISSGQ